MKKQLFFSLIFLCSLSLYSQASSVQFIHNSADKSADTVDIYVNDVKIADDVEFRSSTPFMTISGGTVNVDITDNRAANNSNPLYSQNINLSGGNYIAVLEGILGLGYSPPRSLVPFNIHLQGNISTSTSAGNVDIIFHQGVTDLRSMDLHQVPGKSTILQEVSFGDITSYFTKSANDYVFQIRESSSQFIAGEFEVDLSSNSLSGKAITLLTSGFIDPMVNNYGSNFGLYASLPSGGPLLQFLEIPPSHARVQFIHNSADASVSSVDIWVNNTLIYDDLDYLYCRAFEDFPADSTMVVSVTDANSSNPNNPILTKTINLSGYNTHIFVLEGINSNSGYNPGKSTRPLVLHHISRAAEVSEFSNNTDLAFHNGSTDLDIVDFYNSTVPSFLIINDISYRETSGYIPFATKNFDIQMRGKRQGRIIAQFRLPLSNLNFQDSAGLVVTSGFLNPSQNSNGNDIGLYYAPPAGGPLLEFLKVTITSTLVQFLHNSADESLDTVDIYVDNRRVLNDFRYLHSSPFVAIYADSSQTIYIAPHNSVDNTTAFYSKTVNYDVSTSRYLIIEGIKDPGYNPPGSSNPLFLREYSGAKMLAENEGDIDVLFYNGSTDASQLDIDETSVPIPNLATNLNYGEFSPFRSLTGGNYHLNVEDANNFSNTYDAAFQNYGLTDKAIVVLASGFMNPAQNKNGNPFGMYVSLPNGGKFIELQDLIVGIDEQSSEDVSISIYPNPSPGEFFVKSNLKEATEMELKVHDPNGRLVHQERFYTNSGEGERKINLRNIENGLYLVSLENDNELLQRKMIQIVK